jgi:hypothetical protein
MSNLRYTLLAEGPSDEALLPILDWLFRECAPDLTAEGMRADLSRMPTPARRLPERMNQAVEVFPCHLLFVHRDADNVGMPNRLAEIRDAADEARTRANVPAVIGVVPIRKLDAWLLIDAQAIRWAAGNPNGQQPIRLPLVHELEGIADPKPVLRQLIRDSSGLSGRRLVGMRVDPVLVANRIADFSPLLRLNAIQQLKRDLEAALVQLAL